MKEILKKEKNKIRGIKKITEIIKETMLLTKVAEENIINTYKGRAIIVGDIKPEKKLRKSKEEIEKIHKKQRKKVEYMYNKEQNKWA